MNASLFAVDLWPGGLVAGTEDPLSGGMGKHKLTNSLHYAAWAPPHLSNKTCIILFGKQFHNYQNLQISNWQTED